MPIYPLPQFEADLEADQKAYEALKPPKTIVVAYGSMKLVGEFPYDGDAKPGCGSKLVVRTPRGTEMGEMLTTTCPNSGCGKSVSRQELLRYIENSGGRDYPFTTEGRVLRVATHQDMDRQAALEQQKHELKLRARAVAQRLGLDAMKIVEVEPLLGGERLIVHFAAEERVDFRDFVPELALELGRELAPRIDMHHVGARDEARLTADYERCGQYCCCKNFLKVLKPVSMRSAKTQKATLDPLKISGRCGRLMCCLRYEDQTYEDLRKRLPRRKSRVGTPEGDGLVLDGQILTQLVLVQLEASGKQVAIPVEELTPPQGPPPSARLGPKPDTPPDARRDSRIDARPAPRESAPGPAAPREGNRRDDRPQSRRDAPRRPDPPRAPARPPSPDELDLDDIETDEGDLPPSSGRSSSLGTPPGRPPDAEADAAPDTRPEPEPDAGPDNSPRRRRRRRRRRGGGPPPGTPPTGPSTGPSSGPSGPDAPSA